MQSEYILGGININRNHIHGPPFRTNQPGQHLGDYRGMVPTTVNNVVIKDYYTHRGEL